MSSWTISQPGQDGAGLERPVVVFQSGADFNAVYAGLQAQQLAKQVHSAVALGWSLSELLGRCFLLEDEPVQQNMAWDGAQLVALSEANTPRDEVRSRAEHILFLADILNVRTIQIDGDAAPTPGATYADVLLELVKKFSTGQFDTANGETWQSVLGDINERLYYWDLKIHSALQNFPRVVHSAYLVGQSLSALRWYYRSERSALTQDSLNKLCHEYIPLLEPYLPPFATGALSNSVAVWGSAALSGQVMQDDSPYSPDQLHAQAHIWYDILTGARNPLSYVTSTTRGSRYIWRVMRISWPLFVFPLLALLLILIVSLVVILLNIDQVIKAITAIAGFIALVGTSHIAMSNLNGFVEKALTHTGEALKGSPIETLWHSDQQKAVNDATLIAPPLLPQPGKQVSPIQSVVKPA